MKSLSIVTLSLAIVAFSVSFVAGYLQIYNSSKIGELNKQQQKISDDLLNLQKQFAESLESEKGHAGNMQKQASGKEWPKYHDATATLKLKTDDKIVVDQQEIPGFMKAMMMSYKVESPDQLKQVEENDRVSLTIKETDTDLTVIEIKKLENKS